MEIFLKKFLNLRDKSHTRSAAFHPEMSKISSGIPPMVVNEQSKFQDHNLKLKNRVPTENPYVQLHARLSDCHKKFIRDARYGGEHSVKISGS